MAITLRLFVFSCRAITSLGTIASVTNEENGVISPEVYAYAEGPPSSEDNECNSQSRHYPVPLSVRPLLPLHPKKLLFRNSRKAVDGFIFSVLYYLP